MTRCRLRHLVFRIPERAVCRGCPSGDFSWRCGSLSPLLSGRLPAGTLFCHAVFPQVPVCRVFTPPVSLPVGKCLSVGAPFSRGFRFVEYLPAGVSSCREVPVGGAPSRRSDALSCPALTCPVLSCPVLSCPVFSCPAPRDTSFSECCALPEAVRLGHVGCERDAAVPYPLPKPVRSACAREFRQRCRV